MVVEMVVTVEVLEIVVGDVLHIKNFLSQGYLDGRAPGMSGDTLMLNFNKAHYGNYYTQWKITHIHDRRRNTYAIQSMSSYYWLDGRGPRDSNRVHLTDGNRPRSPAFEDFFEWELQILPGINRVAMKSISSNQYIDGRAPGYSKPLLADANRWDPNREKGLQWIITKVSPPVATFTGDTVSIRSANGGSLLRGPKSIGVADSSRNPFSEEELQWKLEPVGHSGLVYLRNKMSGWIISGPFGWRYKTGAVLDMKQWSDAGYNPSSSHFLIIPYGDKFALRHQETGTFLDGRMRGYVGSQVFLSNADPATDVHKEQLLWDIKVIRKQFGGSFAIPK